MTFLAGLTKTPPYASLSPRAKAAIADAYVEDRRVCIEVEGRGGRYTVLHRFDGDGWEVTDPDGVIIVEGAGSWDREVEDIVRA